MAIQFNGNATTAIHIWNVLFSKIENTIRNRKVSCYVNLFFARGLLATGNFGNVATFATFSLEGFSKITFISFQARLRLLQCTAYYFLSYATHTALANVIFYYGTAKCDVNLFDRDGHCISMSAFQKLKRSLLL